MRRTIEWDFLGIGNVGKQAFQLFILNRGLALGEFEGDLRSN